MDQGLITNPKDLERMQHELVSLERRITSLEDEELEVMARLEDAQRDLDALTRAGRAPPTSGSADAGARRATRRPAEIDARARRDRAAARARRSTGCPADLLALYDKLRDAARAASARPRCARASAAAAGSTIDNAELAVIRQTPDDEVVRCEECQRILVRTAESGL